MKMYTVWDKVAKEAGPIFEAKNDAIAQRNFKRMVDRVGNAEDFEVYFLGEFDNQTMEISLEKRVPVIFHEFEGER